MKFNYYIILMLLPITFFAQNVGIGTLVPDVSSKLDVFSTSQGVLIPRLTEAQRTGIVSPAEGLLVFQTNLASGYYYFNGTIWVGLTSNSWSITGNSGTSPATQFIGTTDATDFVIRTNAFESFRVSSTQKIGFGTTNPLAKIHVVTPTLPPFFLKDFEDNTLASLTTDGGANWFTQSTTVSTGTYAIQSGNIADFQNSNLRLTLNLSTSGTISFDASTSCQSPDGLYFYINGGYQNGYAGNTPWTTLSFPVAAGINNFWWRYYKDGSGLAGADAVYLDNIQITLDNGALLRLQDGQEGNGFVMVSDANGNATWRDPTLIDTPDEDWFFTSGITNTDPLNRLGNVLIGDTGISPSNLRIYNGTILGTEIGIGSSEYVTDRESEFAFSDDLVPVTDNTASIGRLALRWFEIYATNSVIVTSDEKLKEQIKPLSYGIKDLMGIKTIHYQWKNEQFEKTNVNGGDKKNKIGFSAQQLYTKIPEIVENTFWEHQSDGSFVKKPSENLGVYYHEIIPVIVKSVKEHQVDINKIEAQHKEIESLLLELE